MKLYVIHAGHVIMADGIPTRAAAAAVMAAMVAKGVPTPPYASAAWSITSYDVEEDDEE